MTRDNQDKAVVLYAYAESLVDSSYVNEFKPRVEVVQLLNKTYSDLNANDDGEIPAVNFNSLQRVSVGEITVRVKGHVPDGAEEVYIESGSEWKKIIKSAMMTLTFDANTTGVTDIWIDKGKGVKVSVVVEQTRIVKPRYDAIEMM